MRETKRHKQQATLFLPEPQTGFTDYFPVVERKKEPVNHWQELAKAMDKAIVEARHAPELLDRLRVTLGACQTLCNT
jgi:hypothetical protein